MSNAGPSRKLSERLGSLKILWPDVATDKGLRDAIKGGACATGYLAFAYGLAILLILFAGQDALGPIDDDDLLVGMVVVNSLLVLGACVLTWFIWEKQSPVAAGIGLAWIGFELASKLFTLTSMRGTIVVVFALIFAINGVRGTLAAKRGDLLPPVKA